MTPMKILLAAMCVLAACSAPEQGSVEPDDAGTGGSPAAAFDLELVREAIVAECEVEPVLFDPETCEQIDAEQLSASGMTLRVPTSLDAGEAETAASAICEQVAEMRFSGEDNENIGFDAVEVLDAAGAAAAECAAAE